MAPHLHLVKSIGGVVNGNGNNGKKKRRKLIIWGSIVAVLVLLIAVECIAATRGGTKIDPSKLAKVEKGDLAKSVVATGKVTPITKVEVKSKASGIVKKLLCGLRRPREERPVAGATRQDGNRSSGRAVAARPWRRRKRT